MELMKFIVLYLMKFIVIYNKYTAEFSWIDSVTDPAGSYNGK